MIEILISALFLAVGFINFIPLIGLLSNDKITALYDVPAEKDVAILLRHRALLFGILGGVIMLAGFCKSYQPLAFVIGFVSMIGYAVLCLRAESYNAKLGRVLNADWLALGLFTVDLGLRLFAS